jgi:hypothetical protein
MKSRATPYQAGHWLPVPLCLALVVLLLLAVSPPPPAAAQQRFFAGPQEAVQALVAALRTEDLEELAAVFGPGSRELFSSGDEVADRRGRQKFLQAYEEGHSLREDSPDRMVLVLGSRTWPLPIPLVRQGEAWAFDALAGREELLNRRIGRNELRVMETLRAYVDAQHEYATRDCLGSGRVEFARRLASSPGQQDGLYWQAGEGVEESPFGPLIARAARQGYTDAELAPFHGYYFKILTGQGRHATGGAYSYLVQERMLLGFALIAYPAEHGNSGIMTFMVNQEGVIFQKNLGPESKRLAEETELFDPDPTWKRVEEKNAVELP